MTTLQPLHGAGNDLALDLKEWLGLALIEGYVALLVIIHMELCSRTQKGVEVMDSRQAAPTKYWLESSPVAYIQKQERIADCQL